MILVLGNTYIRILFTLSASDIIQGNKVFADFNELMILDSTEDILDLEGIS